MEGEPGNRFFQRRNKKCQTSAVSVYVSAGMMVVLTGAGLVFMEPILGVIGTSTSLH
jgi:hypothetical protein